LPRGAPLGRRPVTQPIGVRAFVGLGSNCETAESMLAAARAAIGALPGMRCGAASPIYRTEPQGYADQPWFFNQVLEVFPAAEWRPCSLVDALLDIEAKLGRVRSPNPALRFGPRVIDADLLLFGAERSDEAHCIVPHPRLVERAFALRPLLDVAPEVLVNGRPLAWWLARLDCRVEGDRIFQ